jgi:hypothetical protein
MCFPYESFVSESDSSNFPERVILLLKFHEVNDHTILTTNLYCGKSAYYHAFRKNGGTMKK